MDNKFLTIPKDDWLRGYNIDVSSHIEKNHKGLKYLSWSFAEMYLRTNFENLVVDFERNDCNYIFGDDVKGYYCLTYIIDVLSNKKTTSLYYPILDSSNRPIVKGLFDGKGNAITLDVMKVNTSLQRARTKIIALTTGIGFSLYNGEDTREIIQNEKVKIEKEQVKKSILEKLKSELDECNSISIYDSILNRWRNAFGKIKESDYKSGIVLLENKKTELENNDEN